MERDKEPLKQEKDLSRDLFHFILLSMQGAEFRRIESTGTIIDVCQTGVEIMTELPLHPGHILQWEDKHKPGSLHIAIVKWSVEQEGVYRGGLEIIREHFSSP
jgi:hypothetical protein